MASEITKRSESTSMRLRKLTCVRAFRRSVVRLCFLEAVLFPVAASPRSLAGVFPRG